ncbi:MAG TPA: glycosyltransferase family 1 protein [Pyrinomonadaceae bacterium]|nr:glycosyltransferase family 1 protein [Pyrinomonadaceae bacterium]
MSNSQQHSSPALNVQAVTQPLPKGSRSASEPAPDLVCFSHLRWDWVYQRPQHLLKRGAAERRVFFIEEAMRGSGSLRLEVRERENGVQVVTPILPDGLSSQIAQTAVLSSLLQTFFSEHQIQEYVLWYYTPMALDFTKNLSPLAVIYDCMDELSAFKGAPDSLRFQELELLNRADVVFTGGHSLYEVKRHKHPFVHPFPSSIDREHFMQARTRAKDPEDQEPIAYPRLGYFGVIDERFDTGLLDAVAAARPDWQLVMLGPVTKIDPKVLPQRPNIHYLGSKTYDELPRYIAGWDVALMPFAINEATRYISPTKTPEYLAAGKPVVSTPIADVIKPYGKLDLVRIARTPDEFIAAIEQSLNPEATSKKWLQRVDEFLANISWDKTWAGMSELIDRVSLHRRKPNVMAAKARATGPALVTSNAA